MYVTIVKIKITKGMNFIKLLVITVAHAKAIINANIFLNTFLCINGRTMAPIQLQKVTIEENKNPSPQTKILMNVT
jgi:hypothetical protein